MTSPRLTARALIRLTPLDEAEDAASFLQGLVTNDVKGPLPCYAALLSAQGKTLFDMIVWPGDAGNNGDETAENSSKSLLIDCEAASADELVKRLTLYRLRRKIAIAKDDSLGVYWKAEPGANGTPDPRLAALGHRWIAPLDASDTPVDDAWLQHRLALGVAEGRAELNDILWLETNAVELNGVSFTKGCYVGQENTARMNWRQKINRRVLVVPAAQSDEKRTITRYDALGLAVDHLRVEGLDPALLPAWIMAEENEA